MFGGLAGTRERYSVNAGNPRTTNADAVAGFEMSRFRFNTTEISSRFILYPSLTTPGRTRLQFKSDLRLKLAKDFYWGLHLYENYDTKPPVPANKNDFGISASLGWRF